MTKATAGTEVSTIPRTPPTESARLVGGVLTGWSVFSPTAGPRLDRQLPALMVQLGGAVNPAGAVAASVVDLFAPVSRTARNHVASILATLKMDNRIQAAVYASPALASCPVLWLLSNHRTGRRGFPVNLASLVG